MFNKTAPRTLITDIKWLNDGKFENFLTNKNPYAVDTILLTFFQNDLAFNQSIKSLYLILSVIITLLFYLIVCFFIKAFQMNDINLKY